MTSVKRFGAQLALGVLLAAVGLGNAQGHELPYPVSSSYGVTQKNNVGTHTGVEAWAYDFGIGDGQPIVATEAGSVKLVKEDSNVYGCGASFANSGNYVVVDHGNGQSSLYLHLQQNSVVVNVGDKVVKGQRLGKVGNTGWMCGSSGGGGYPFTLSASEHVQIVVLPICPSSLCSTVTLASPRYESQ